MSSRRATCHCGAVELKVRLTGGMAEARRCDCSFCMRRGAVAVSAMLDDLEVVKGKDVLRLYSFGTHTAKHYFCGTCGIYTHHQRRSDPDQFGVNAACIEGVNIRELGEIRWVDGINHPADRDD